MACRAPPALLAFSVWTFRADTSAGRGEHDGIAQPEVGADTFMQLTLKPA